MAFLDAFLWLGKTPPGQFLQASTLTFAVVQSLHLLGLAGLAGAAIASNLAVLGVGFQRQQARGIVVGLRGLFWTSLAVTATSGVLLVSAGPFKYYSNPLFPVKLGLLVLALAVQGALIWRVARASETEADRAAKALASASLVLWLAVLVAGRWLGLI